MTITEKELRQAISYHYEGRDWARLWFTCKMVAHAGKNIPRERLRKWGASEGHGSEQNWADYVSLVSAILPVALLLGFLYWL